MSNNQSGPSMAKAYAIIALVVIVAAILAIVFATGRGDDGAQTSVQRSGSLIPLDEVVDQVAPVTIIGDPLPDYVEINDPAVGMAAPSITATHFDGSETTIDFADGTPRLVTFVAHWCPHCQNEVPQIVERFETGGFPPSVRLLGISTAVDRGRGNYPPTAWLLTERWPMPVLRDSAESGLAEAFGLSGWPFTVAVDANGEVIYRNSGAVPPDAMELILGRLADSAG